MLSIILGSFLLSVIHAAIPNHWLPLAVLSKSERWSRSETLLVTAIVGFAHTLSTVIIGILVGMAGYELWGRYSSLISRLAPSLFVVLGAVYLAFGFKHNHHSHLEIRQAPAAARKSSIILSLSVAMFFSPCLEIEAYYFSAGSQGWGGIAAVSMIYLIVTIAGMITLVDLALSGVKRIRSHFLEHHEKKITGLVLIGLGILSYFVKY